MVIKELLQLAKGRLKNTDYMDPIKESVYVLEKILDKDKSFIYTNLDKWVSREEEEKFLDIIDRRSKGEPMAYIFKQREFMGIDFFVDKGVLIPRPETEMLVEYLINYIKTSFTKKQVNILDIGSGSGAISISLGKYCANTKVLGVDISEDALKIAGKNLDRLKLTNVSFRKSNLFESIGTEEKFDIIVSNPPYIKRDALLSLQRDVRDFEPSLALDGGRDGLLFYKEIIKKAGDHLKDKGMLIFEIGFDQGPLVKDLMEGQAYKKIEIIKDFQSLDRIVIGFKK